jgi:hypothetical protein
MKKLRCSMEYGRIDSKRTRCKNPYYISIRVRVLHPETKRKTWQTWHLCKKCFKDFMKRKGLGYYMLYHKNPVENPVIGYEEPKELNV